MVAKSDWASMAEPVSPGDVLRQTVLSRSDITQDELAKALNVSRFSVNQIVNGKRNITADMALRIAQVTGTSADFWMNLQRDVDLFLARSRLAQELSSLERLMSFDATVTVETDDF